MSKRKVPNVVRGGVAIPLKGKTNYYYMQGRKHKDGGIDIGENPRTGLEVEDGEVMHVADKEIKVFSSVPFLNGKSPAQKIMGGENPTKVFNQQEEFKDRKGLNDDGTKKNNRRKAEMGIWDDIDDAVDTAEKTLAIPNAAASAATLVAPNPYTAAAAYITGLGGAAIDLYQGTRAAIKGDWSGVGKNAADIGISLIGLRALKNAKKLRDLDKTLNASGVTRQYVTKNIGRGRGRHKVTTTKEIDKSINNEAIGYGAIPVGTAMNLADSNSKKKQNGSKTPNRKKYTTVLTDNEEKQFQSWYSKVAKYKNLNPNPDANGQDYDYRGYWKNEDRNGILGSNPNAHFTDRYKQPTHPTFSNESKYSNSETPGGTWVKGKGTWLFKHNRYTARQANRTADYLNGTGEGYILGTDTIIPNKRKKMGGLSRKQDYESKSKPYPKVKAGDFAGSGRSYPIPTKDDAVDALRLAGLHGRSDVKAKVYSKYPELRRKAKAGGLYSVTVDGKTKLKMFPSTGEETLNKRHKFVTGGSYFDNYIPLKNTVKAVTPWERLSKEQETYDNNSKSFDENGKFINPWGRLADEQAKEQKDDTYKPFDNGDVKFVSPWEHLAKEEEAYKNSTYETIPGVPWSRKPKTPEMLADEQYKKENANVPEMLLRPRDQVETEDTTKDKNKNNWFKRTVNNAKQYIKDNPDTISNVVTDGIGLASNIAGGFISHNMNKKMLNKLKYNSQPIARQAAKLKTRININPQLDKMRESLAAYEKDIDTNTASSRVALARKQRARLANMLQTNDLFGNKENIETELINKDKLNQQSVADANIRDYNDWSEKKAAFENAVREKKAENDVSLINIMNTGIQDVISRGEKRKSERQTRLAMAAANPNVNPRILKDLGIKGISDDDIERWEKAFAKKKKKNNNEN